MLTTYRCNKLLEINLLEQDLPILQKGMTIYHTMSGSKLRIVDIIFAMNQFGNIGQIVYFDLISKD